MSINVTQKETQVLRNPSTLILHEIFRIFSATDDRLITNSKNNGFNTF